MRSSPSRDPFDVSHRPWPLPARPWVMTQTWHDLLFAHWPVEPAMLRPSIPAGLELDTFEGQAWVGVVPFRMSNVCLRLMPLPAPWFSAFPELNVRTYVTAPGGDKPGIYFYSLDAGNPVAVALARLWYHLPYFAARMSCRRAGEWVSYASQRMHPGAAPSDVVGQYRPTGPVFRSRPGSLEAWLTDRYCLYTSDRHGRAYRGEIHHAPWPLQPAEAELHVGTLVTQHGIRLPDRPPLLHFARRLTVRAWTLEQIGPRTAPFRPRHRPHPSRCAGAHPSPARGRGVVSCPEGRRGVRVIGDPSHYMLRCTLRPVPLKGRFITSQG